MIKKSFIVIIVIAFVVALVSGCGYAGPGEEPPSPSQTPPASGGSATDTGDSSGTDGSDAVTPAQPETNGGDLPVVYMTSEISPESLVAVYEALGVIPTGRIAIKITSGEPPNSNYLRPELIKDLVQTIGGTLVESNTVAGNRASTAKHWKVVEDHGYLEIAEFDLLDGEAEIIIPVIGGEVLSENYVGANFVNYDFYVILSHFKGHASAGYGGAIKNMSIGIASSAGKSWIHSGGTRKTGYTGDQDAFLMSMAEAAKSIVDYLGGPDQLLYINVMNRLSVDCDCMGNPAEPDMHDIGILASLDPVALDRACVDLVEAAPDGASLIARIDSRNGTYTMDHGAKIGLGSLGYTLVNIDN